MTCGDGKGSAWKHEMDWQCRGQHQRRHCHYGNQTTEEHKKNIEEELRDIEARKQSLQQQLKDLEQQS